MKKLRVLFLMLLAVSALSAVAYADVISSPAVTVTFTVIRFLPWILVGAVVGVTAYLLKKFWTKRK